MSKTTEKLFIGQSAMSHSLNCLRQTLDDPILFRTTTGMKPITRAEALIIPIRKALLEIELTVSNIPGIESRTAQHQFTIAATDYNELMLTSHIKKVRELAPDVNSLSGYH